MTVANNPSLVNYQDSLEGEEDGIWHYPVLVCEFAGAFAADGKIRLLDVSLRKRVGIWPDIRHHDSTSWQLSTIVYRFPE